ncbi:MAG: hypothetical protein M3Q74_08365 [Pseudomonadota bacterium]|nr:hypothetical protein [Pseudomonadota bacterium]
MTNANVLSRFRTSPGGMLRITLFLAGVIIFMWADALGFIGRSSEIGTPLFWSVHVLLIVSIVAAITVFRRRGLWSLLGLVALLPGPLWVAALFYACAAEGQCV